VLASSAQKPDDAVAQAVTQLRLKFVDSLDERILQFEAVLADLRRGGDQHKALRNISALAHKIAGIAPTFGFSAIGTQARQIEQMIDRQIRMVSAQETMDQVFPALQGFLDDLESLMDEV